MNQRIKKIDFVFENCEVITVKDPIPQIYLYKMKNGDGYKNIHPEQVIIVFNDESYISNEKLVERIKKYNDIVSLHLYTDGEDSWYSIFVPWDDSHDEYNTYQDVKSNNVAITVSISEDNKSKYDDGNYVAKHCAVKRSDFGEKELQKCRDEIHAKIMNIQNEFADMMMAYEDALMNSIRNIGGKL